MPYLVTIARASFVACAHGSSSTSLTPCYLGLAVQAARSPPNCKCLCKNQCTAHFLTLCLQHLDLEIETSLSVILDLSTMVV